MMTYTIKTLFARSFARAYLNCLLLMIAQRLTMTYSRYLLKIIIVSGSQKYMGFRQIYRILGIKEKS
ncbi:MAG TPA: hypothetical protein DF294_13205 [Psychrobacter sp.]|nr:hypothetical protein [Psychrobacter sp.]